MTAIPDLTDEQWLALRYDWRGVFARPTQIEPPGDWLTWLVMAGRGMGKTRIGAEFIRDGAENAGCRRMALVGATAADVRDTMIEGESGLIECCPPWNRPKYQPSKRRVIWTKKSHKSYGARAMVYSADEPERLRGPQNERAWCDDMAAWRAARIRLTWDNLLLGLRIGEMPRCVITTTPKPLRILREIRDDPTTHVTTGSTYENLENLAPTFKKKILSKYEGTSKGEQELMGKLLDEAEGALWARKNIEDYRIQAPPDLYRIVVAVDPSVTSTEDSDECGIVVVGAADNGHLYVLDDLSDAMSPDAWANAAIGGYRTWRADRIVAEVNNGGDLVESVIRTKNSESDDSTPVSYSSVWASRGKHTRAEPIAALYEQHRVHHVGVFPELEDELCNWVPGEKSPNRLDALVWGATKLLNKKRKHGVPKMHGSLTGRRPPT